MEKIILSFILLLTLFSCTPTSTTNSKFSSSLTTSSSSSSTSTLSVLITGLASGTILALSNNQSETILAIIDGTYSFSYAYPKGSAYYVSIISQPTGQTCSIPISSGYVSTSTTSVLVVCDSEDFTVGGTVSGLSGTLILQQGTELKTVTSNGAFVLSNSVDYKSSYAVTVYSNPAGQTCTVSNGTGTMGLSGVSNVSVTCTNNSYTIGGTVSGISGSVTIQNSSNSESKTLSSSGSYTFSNSVTHGSSYSVSVTTQPATQTCLVDNSAGTISGANVSNIDLTCATSYKVGGTVSGLATGGSLVLTNKGTDNKTITGNGVYQFATGLYNSDIYLILVATQPTGQNCVILDGDGDHTGTISSASITDADVSCSSYSYGVGGTVSGLASGGSVVLQNNGGDDETVTSNTTYTFDTSIAHASTYSTTVLTQPTGQTCTVSNGSGTINGADVTNTGVACVNNTYDVTVAVVGTLTGTVVLTNNSTDDLTITAAGSSYTFSTQVAHLDTYAVAVKTQPTAEKCTLASNSGTINGAGVTATLTCATAYTVGGTLTGLASNVSIVLDNTSDPLTLTANGAYTFAQKLLTGEDFNVTITTQPTGQGCIFTGLSSGTIAGANESAIDIQCTSNTYTLGGNITGLGGNTIQLKNTANDETYDTAVDGAYTFATGVDFDTTYDVVVNTQPTGKTCTVSNGSATHDVASNITNVNVSCDTATYTIAVDVGSMSGVVNPIVIQNNGGDSVTVTTTGQYTFPTSITYNNTYNVSVYSYPTDHTCEVVNGSGTATANVTDVSVDCYLTVSPKYSAAPKWNDYVRSYSTTAVCTGGETDYDDCIHGGETKTVTTPYTACEPLTMSDNLGVFDWTCSDTTGTAKFTSKLKEDKGLMDLISVWGVFNNNYVTLTNGTTDVLYSKSLNTWWTNTIDITEATLTGVLSNPSTLYGVTTDSLPTGFIITGDKVGLFTLTGVTSTSTVGADNVDISGDTGGVDDREALIAGSSQKFIWIEGNFVGTSDDHIVYLWGNKFSRIHNLHSNGGDFGIYLNNSDYNYILGARITNVSYDAISFYDSDKNFVGRSKVSDASNGVLLYNSDSNRFENVVSYNNIDGFEFSYSDSNVGTLLVSSNNSGDGIRLYASDSNRFLALTLANNSDDGIELDETSDSNIINNVVLHNNGDYGLVMGNSSNYNFVSQLVARDNKTKSVYLNSSSYNKFAGNMKVPVTTTYCTVSGGTEPGLNPANCAAADRSVGYLNLLSGSTLSSTFIGIDSASAAKPTLDFNDGSSDFGVWMLYSAQSYPDQEFRGLCTLSDNCIFFDYQVDQADTRLLNRSGDGQNANDTLVGEASCPTEVDGDEYFSKQSSPSYINFLKNAVEILSDFNVGDNDGLCEGGEACLYMPNFGAYQGSGDATSCNFSSYGSFSNIIMYGYPTNGE